MVRLDPYSIKGKVLYSRTSAIKKNTFITVKFDGTSEPFCENNRVRYRVELFDFDRVTTRKIQDTYSYLKRVKELKQSKERLNPRVIDRLEQGWVASTTQKELYQQKDTKLVISNFNAKLSDKKMSRSRDLDFTPVTGDEMISRYDQWVLSHKLGLHK